jgi:3-deoxy-7-phosphoheptulonate synthase
MIITLGPDAVETHVDMVREILDRVGWQCTRVKTQCGDYLVAIGSREFDFRQVGQLPGVADLHIVQDVFQLVSRSWKVGRTVIHLGDDVQIGGGGCTMMAGPCSIETEQETALTADFLASNSIRVMRGGAFKPRSSPYTFRGLGLEGLKFFSAIAKARGLKVISEVLEVSQIEPMYPYVDIYQVGARNSQNFSLLHELGRVDKPVLIKRGLSGTVEELLQSAEYVFSNGNERLLLCERGIRTYEKAYRNTLDLNAVPTLREKSHLPVIVDPSHGIGVRKFVAPMALSALMAGADGLLVEIHQCPERALSDGAQTLSFGEAEKLFTQVQDLIGMRAGWHSAK